MSRSNFRRTTLRFHSSVVVVVGIKCACHKFLATVSAQSQGALSA